MMTSDEWRGGPPVQLSLGLARHVASLAAAPRPSGSRSHEAARVYIRAAWEACGLRVDAVRVGDRFRAGINLESRPTPDDPRLPLIVLGAHYDSSPRGPGADDNASAVAALLEVGRFVAALGDDTPMRVALVAFDLEEDGRSGSLSHAARMRAAGPAFLGAIVLDMVGYACRLAGSQGWPGGFGDGRRDVADFIGLCGNPAASGLIDRLARSFTGAGGLPVERLTIGGGGHATPWARSSDHASYWDLELPSVMVTDTAFLRNPNYHRPTDTPETLDYDFLASVVLGLAGFLLAGPEGRPH